MAWLACGQFFKKHLQKGGWGQDSKSACLKTFFPPECASQWGVLTGPRESESPPTFSLTPSETRECSSLILTSFSPLKQARGGESPCERGRSSAHVEKWLRDADRLLNCLGLWKQVFFFYYFKKSITIKHDSFWDVCCLSHPNIPFNTFREASAGLKALEHVSLSYLAR